MTARQTTASPAAVTITHPDKVLFPDDGITKADLAAYYAAVADVMVPHVRGRPITMERFPSGIGRPGFLQKNVVSGFPSWLGRARAPKKDGVVHYALADDARALRWMANQNAITLHMWTSRAPALGHPDICIFDLDPSDDDADAVREAALGLRDLLHELGVSSVVKTSGSKGFHIAVRLEDDATFAASAEFADRVAAVLVERQPTRLTLAFSKAERHGRIYVDTARNRGGATVAAPYTVRARRGAPVSAPCTWDEIASGAARPATFTLRSMPARLAEVGDLWAPLLSPAGTPSRRRTAPRTRSRGTARRTS